MNINYQAIFIFLAITFTCGITYVITKPRALEKSNNKVTKIKRVIGIVSFGQGNAVDQISQGFKETLSKSKRIEYIFRQSSANGDEVLARSLLEEFVDSEVDLIFTIGSFCSQIAKNITKKRNKQIPIIFGAVTNPVNVNLVDSEASSGNNLTGVTDIDVPWEERIAILTMIKPKISRVVVACNYCPGEMLEKEVMEIEKICKNRNIYVDIIPIYKKNEVIPKVIPFLTQNCDVLFCLRDSTVIDCMDALVKICNREKVTIFSMYLDDARKGAALSFGLHERTFGIKSAKIAEKILNEGILPRDIPIQCLDSSAYRLKINKQAAAKQGLEIDASLAFLIKNADIV